MFRSSMIPMRQGRMGTLTGGRWEHLPSRIFGEMSHAVSKYLPFGKRYTQNMFIPRVEVIEDEVSFQVDAELPGVDAEDIEITLSRDTLTIRGEKREEIEHDEEGVYCSERFFGPFSREICLPKDVDAGRAEAVYDNGVLYINLPKVRSDLEHKKIPIRRL
jgi:HSP20 family protein